MKKTVLVKQFYGVFKHLNLYALSFFTHEGYFMALKHVILNCNWFY